MEMGKISMKDQTKPNGTDSTPIKVRPTKKKTTRDNKKLSSADEGSYHSDIDKAKSKLYTLKS